MVTSSYEVFTTVLADSRISSDAPAACMTSPRLFVADSEISVLDVTPVTARHEVVRAVVEPVSVTVINS